MHSVSKAHFYSVNWRILVCWLLISVFRLSAEPLLQDSTKSGNLLWPADYVLDSLIISGDPFYPEQAVREGLNLNFYQHNIFNARDAEAIISVLIDYYLDQGFPFCSANAERIVLDDSLRTVTFTVKLATGRMSTISFVDYLGIKTNQTAVLNRQSRLSAPFVFDQRMLLAAEQYLYASELFTEFPRWKIVQQPDQSLGIRFSVSEDKYNSVDAVLGYSQDANKNSDNGGLRGKVELAFKNLFGTLRQLKINWQRRSELEETIYLYYREPWLLNVPLSAYFSFTQNFQDKSYLERYYTCGADYQINYYLNLITDYTYGEIMPDSLLISKGESRVEKQIFAGGAHYQKFNRQKEFFRSDMRLATVLKKSTTQKESEDGYQALWSNEWKKKISGPFFLKQRVRAEYVVSDSLAQYDLIKFGGLNSLRGYFEEQYSTDLLFLSRNDLIWQTTDNTELFLFSDCASYRKYNKNLNIQSNSDFQLLAGSGGGIRFENNLGTFEISYGIALKEGFDTAKLHFLYKNEF